MLYLLIALLALIAVLVVRTLRFTPKPAPAPAGDTVEFDKEKAVSNLQQLVRCKTVSYHDSALEDPAEFEKLIALLPELYPHVFAACSFDRLPDRALLFRWPGKNPGDPAVLMAHFDVVPADPSGWDKDPFAAEIENGVLWGRGTLDTKVTFNGVLTAADHLIAGGFTPENDIYFAFSGMEEIGGPGAKNIVDWFRDHNITPSLVVDEGGAVVEGVFPGVKAPYGLIGIAEKGSMNATFTLKSQGGHASAPPPHTPIGRLARACCKVEDHPFPMHLTKPAAEMFDTLGRHSGFLFRMLFANLWLFKPVLDLYCRMLGGEINALLRTTVAFTQSGGSPAPNVIPPVATLTANLRINPADSLASAKAYLEKTIGDPEIQVTVSGGMEPSRISTTDCPGWEKVSAAVRDTWAGCIVAPYLMVQCSDSRHYGAISDKVYRFSAMDLTSEERRTIHGHNERIRLETLHRSVEFYIRLMQSC